MPSPLNLKAFIDQALSTFEVPGAAIAVIQKGQLAFAGGFGLLNSGCPETVDEHTLFAIASISKSSTALCLALLVDEGRLDWDDRVIDLLPGFRLYDTWVTQEMRVRDLLIHNSGLTEVSGGTIWYGSDLSRAEVMRRLRYLRPVSSFRSQYAYQNTMYMVAGEIILALSGQSWDEFLTRRILRPLGMLRTCTSLAELQARENVAAPHARIQGRVIPVPFRNHDNVGPAASINTSAWELAQYARLFLGRGEYAGQRFFSQACADEIWKPQFLLPPDGDPPALLNVLSGASAYCFGWRTRLYRGHRMFEHAGGVDGMRSLLTLLPDEGTAVVALSNAESRGVVRASTYAILDDTLGQPDVDWLAVFAEEHRDSLRKAAEREEQATAGRIPGTRPSLGLEEYCGSYADPLIDDVSVALEAGRLVLRFRHTPAFTADLEHWHYDTFRLTWRDPYIPWGLATFQLDARGKPHALRLDQPSLLDVDFSELDLRRALTANTR